MMHIEEKQEIIFLPKIKEIYEKNPLIAKKYPNLILNLSDIINLLLYFSKINNKIIFNKYIKEIENSLKLLGIIIDLKLIIKEYKNSLLYSTPIQLKDNFLSIEKDVVNFFINKKTNISIKTFKKLLKTVELINLIDDPIFISKINIIFTNLLNDLNNSSNLTLKISGRNKKSINLKPSDYKGYFTININTFIDKAINHYIDHINQHSNNLIQSIIIGLPDFAKALNESWYKSNSFLFAKSPNLNYIEPSMQNVSEIRNHRFNEIVSNPEHVEISQLEDLSTNLDKNKLELSSGNFNKIFMGEPLFNTVDNIINDSLISNKSKQLTIEKVILNYGEEFFKLHFTKNLNIKNTILKETHNKINSALNDLTIKYTINNFKNLLIGLNKKDIRRRNSIAILFIILLTSEVATAVSFNILIKLVINAHDSERINKTDITVNLGKAIVHKFLIAKYITEEKISIYDNNAIFISENLSRLFKLVSLQEIKDMCKEFTTLEYTWIGSPIIEIMINYSNLFHERMDTKNYVSILRLSIDTSQMHRLGLTGISLSHYPMIVRPNKPNERGVYFPYIMPETTHFWNTKNTVIKDKFDQILSTENQEVLYPTINLLNKNRFKINHDMLDFIIDEWNNSKSFIFKGLNIMKPLEESNNEKKREILSHNSKHINFFNTISVAYLYRKQTFYLPTFADFRGRIYTFPNALSYQGSDISRALILFDPENKEYLNKDGYRYLLLFFASLAGQSKKSVDEKILFAENKIIPYYTLYIENKVYFMENIVANLSEPLQFMSILFALYNVKKEWAKGNEVIINNPILFDASCNGIQHLSAMTSEIETAKRVNLIPSYDNDSGPADLYSYMAIIVQKRLSASNSLTYNRILVNRKLVKSTVMTLPYNVTVTGVADQLESFCTIRRHKLGFNEFILPSEYSKDKEEIVLNRSLILNLAKVFYHTIQKEIPTLSELRNYLNKLIDVILSIDGKFFWITPNGLKISLGNREFLPQKTKTTLTPNSRYITIHLPTNNLDIDKSQLGFIPNMIHSLDGSNIHLLIKYLIKNSPDMPLFTIHDCFATTPNNMNELEFYVKTAFIEIYFTDEGYLQKMHDSFIEQIESFTDIYTKKKKNETIQYILNNNSEEKIIPVLPSKFTDKNIWPVFKTGIMDSKYFIS